jgi:hypothetical protein
MKRQRQILLFGILLLAFGSLLCILVRHPREPTYDGKTVAQWFQELLKARPKYFKQPEIFRPTGQLISVLDSVALQQDPAANALRALGTNAAIYFAEAMCGRDPVWAPAYRNLFFKFPPGLRKIAPSPPAIEYMRSSEAALGLSMLGHHAVAAAPILIRNLENCDQFRSVNIINALKPLPFKPTDFDAVLERMAQRGQITNVVRILTELSIHTPTAVRILAKALSSGDSPTKQSAVTQLERFGSDAAPALPELKTALADANDEVRYKAACALANFGTNAQPAFRELSRATNDTSTIVRGAANRALRGFSPTPTDRNMQ